MYLQSHYQNQYFKISWVKRTDDDDMSILSHNSILFTTDKRYSVGELNNCHHWVLLPINNQYLVYLAEIFNLDDLICIQ